MDKEREREGRGVIRGRNTKGGAECIYFQHQGAWDTSERTTLPCKYVHVRVEGERGEAIGKRPGWGTEHRRKEVSKKKY